MRTARISSFTFGTLAVASMAAALDPSAALASDRPLIQHDLAPPAIVLTPPTPKPSNIGIFRLPVTGMHTQPMPYNAEAKEDGIAVTGQPGTPDGQVPDGSLPHAADAGVRPMSPEAMEWQRQQQQAEEQQLEAFAKPATYRVQAAHTQQDTPTPHPLRSAPSLRHRRASPDAPAGTTRIAAADDVTERRDSSGRVHLARMRAFVAKAEYRNRRRRSQEAAASHALEARGQHRQPSQFASIDVVASPTSVKADSPEADLASVNVGLGGGLDVTAVVTPGVISQSDRGGSSGSSSSSSTHHSKPKGKSKGGEATKHSKSKSKGTSFNDDDEDDDANGSSDSGSSSGSGSGSSSSSSPNSKLAKVTWYAGSHLLNPACGGPSPSDHSLVAAVNRHSPFASCGDVLTIRSPRTGHAVRVRIVDWCDTCSATEPWFDLTKGAFERLADLEVGVLKGLTFERAREAAVKKKQRERNHDLTERAGVEEDEEPLYVRRGGHDDLAGSLLAGDFGSDRSSSGIGSSTGSLFKSIIGLLTGATSSSLSTDADSGSAPTPSKAQHQHTHKSPVPSLTPASSTTDKDDDDGENVSLLGLDLGGGSGPEDEDEDEDEDCDGEDDDGELL